MYSTFATQPDARRLLDFAASKGATIPPALSHPLDALAPLFQPMNHRDTVAGVLEDYLHDPDRTMPALDELALAHARRGVLADMGPWATDLAVHAFEDALQGAAGTRLAASLDKAFQKAWKRFAAVAAHVGPDTTGEDVLNAGAEASQAWRDAPEATGEIEAYLAGYVEPVAFTFGTGTLTGASGTTHMWDRAALLVTRPDQVGPVALALRAPFDPESRTGRVGVIWSACPSLRINSLATARDLLADALAAYGSQTSDAIAEDQRRSAELADELTRDQPISYVATR